MNFISAFDIIGPNMIGPSSSHTAGALKIARVAFQEANKIDKTGIKIVKFKLFGSFSRTYMGHGTDKALLAGIMGFEEEDPRIQNAFEIAKDKGLNYKFILNFDIPIEELPHSNSVLISIATNNGIEFEIMGLSIGGGAIEILPSNPIKF